jgi:hypothetical protein
MAGIRPQRGGALTSTGIALIVVVVVCVASLIALVILYTGQTKLNEDREAAIKEFEKVATRGEFAQYQSLAVPPQTVLGRMAEERRGMAKWITGSEGDDKNSAAQQIQARYQAIVDAKRIDNPDAFKPEAQLPLLNAVGNLADSLAKERQRRELADKNLAAARTHVIELTQARDGAKQQFDQQVADIEGKLKETQDQLAAYQKAKDAELASLTANATKAEDQLSKDRDRHKAELEAKDTDLTKIRNRLNDALTTLKQLRGQPDMYAAAKEVDGKIIRALPGDPYVYINLGAKDRVSLGMTFAVYSAGEGIPTTGEGKATVEISSVYDDVAAGKIISRSRNQPVLEGDLVANAIYSKARKHKFLVDGRFDLENAGVATAANADRIKAMVQEWGGELVDTVDTGTDFVVLGQGPAEPIAPPASATPIDKQRYQEALKAYQAFQDNVKEAKELMVPILSQTQFLYFVGYNLDAIRTGKTEARAKK